MRTGSGIEYAATPLPRSRVTDFLALAKLRLTSLVLFTTAAGFYLGWSGPVDVAFLFGLVHVVLGTALVAGGAMALNQYVERDTDAMMERTRLRPLPNARLRPQEAFAFGSLLVVVGLGYLAVVAGALPMFLAGVTAGSYVLVYTPLKTRTPLCTLVGAVPGAIPPVIGYAAAAGAVDLKAWSLFAILFIWQVPHFLAIAWLYREDYARAGQAMLSVTDPDGRRTAHHVVQYCLMLFPTGLLPSFVGLTGGVYAAVAIVLGISLILSAANLARWRTRASARRLFLASVIYLPVLLAVMVSDRL